MEKAAPVPSKGKEGGPINSWRRTPGVINCFCNSVRNRAVGGVCLPGVRTEPRVIDGWPPCQTPAQDRG